MSFPLSRPSIFCKTSSSLNKLPSFPARLSSSTSFNRCFSRQISCCGMSPASETTAPSTIRRTITISYSELINKNLDLSMKIEEGFGPNGLGILSISNVPELHSLRQNLLRLAPRLANLPEEVKKDLEDPHSRYNFGWSHGKETLESGKPDMLKGSYYANPVLDRPTREDSLIQRYPSYCQPNIWPVNALPEFETAFKSLGKLMLEVGLILAYHCDRYVSKWMTVHDEEGLEEILLRSRCHKGRLLYYFPGQKSDTFQDSDNISSWCGWHTDHGSLTGLTCGMFMRDAVVIPCPDKAAGLYIKTRAGQIVKAVFGEDELAYQIGETTEILSGGRLCATPHCVQVYCYYFAVRGSPTSADSTADVSSKAPKGENAVGVDRSTFALFMQPDWDENLKFPGNVHLHQAIIPPNGTLTFGEYSEKLLDKYYDQKS